MKKKGWKICAGWILGMAVIVTLSEGCRNSTKMDESPKTQKQEKTEEKTKADLKKLQKVNRMDYIAEEYQTVKEETKIYSEDGSNILEEYSGVRYYDTYEDEDVNLWEDSDGERIDLIKRKAKAGRKKWRYSYEEESSQGSSTLYGRDDGIKCKRMLEIRRR